jgi:hypothetical protein
MILIALRFLTIHFPIQVEITIKKNSSNQKYAVLDLSLQIVPLE